MKKGRRKAYPCVRMPAYCRAAGSQGRPRVGCRAFAAQLAAQLAAQIGCTAGCRARSVLRQWVMTVQRQFLMPGFSKRRHRRVGGHNCMNEQLQCWLAGCRACRTAASPSVTSCFAARIPRARISRVRGKSTLISHPACCKKRKKRPRELRSSPQLPSSESLPNTVRSAERACSAGRKSAFTPAERWCRSKRMPTRRIS